jgi:hypothetical protein
VASRAALRAQLPVGSRCDGLIFAPQGAARWGSSAPADGINTFRIAVDVRHHVRTEAAAVPFTLLCQFEYLLRNDFPQRISRAFCQLATNGVVGATHCFDMFRLKCHQSPLGRHVPPVLLGRLLSSIVLMWKEKGRTAVFLWG